MENYKANIVYKPIRANFVDLPSNLSNILNNASINPQDVIIELILQSKQKIYTAWSGMSSPSINSLLMDPELARSFHLKENQSVTINAKINNYVTTTVNVEPETSSDWELVLLHAGILEETIANQARVVAINQIIIAYPSKTSFVRLIVKDIGTKDHSHAKLDPFAEIAIAPKEREKVSNSTTKSTKSSKSSKLNGSSTGVSYSNLPSVLKRGISLPHDMFSNLPGHANVEGYEVYVNYNEVINTLKNSDYVAVSLIPGPNQKQNTISAQNQQQEQQQQEGDSKGKDKKKTSIPLKENKRIIAKLVNYTDCPPNTIGLSPKLAISLNAEFQVGLMALLKPAVKNIVKRPPSLIIHPYIIQTKKTNQININSTTKKENDAKLIEQLTGFLYNEHSPLSISPLTNYVKIPKIPYILPNGGLLKFKRNDDSNAWIKPYDIDTKKISKIELGEELLRNSSFIEETEEEMKDDESNLQSCKESNAVGLDKAIDTVVQTISTFKNSGTLIHGNSGSGKTLLLKIIGNKLNSKYGYHTKYISCDKIMNENFSSLSNNYINKWIQECSWHKPSLLILDNLDKILSAEMEHVDSTNSKQLTEFFISQLQKIYNQPNNNVSLLISGISKESFNNLLFQSHVIENFHHLSVPDKATRSGILENYLKNDLNCEINFDIMDMVSETEGFLPNDLKILCDRMYHETLFSSVKDEKNDINNKNVVTKAIFEKAFQGYTPSNLRGVKLQKSSVDWSDIGGLKEAKNILLETLEWPTRYAPIFANCPLRLRSGILLYGYPGCGKTLLASAIAGQCGLNFISIKGPEILNKYIGASEQSVRELFERAQSAKPCILFFDEFDSIAPKRGHDSTGVTDRVVNQMLTQMDGAEGLDGVYVLAATSRPDLIDSALLRPGRLDKSVICDMPSFDDRLDILKTITLKMELSNDINLNTIAERTNGFSGADMQGLGYNAYLKAVHVKLSNDEKLALKGNDISSSRKSYDFFQVNSDKLKSNQLRPADRVKLAQQIENLFIEENSNDANTVSNKDVDQNDESLKVYITMENFEESLKETKPSISVIEKRKLSGIYNKFVSGRDGNMPDGTASGDIGGRTTLM